MDDKTLLELAAKAVGVNVWTDIDGNYYSEGFGVAERSWNPLTDDGDALRLAVKLERFYDKAVWKKVFAIRNGFDFGVDEYAATRRSIVRAAAEIGKNMLTGS